MSNKKSLEHSDKSEIIFMAFLIVMSFLGAYQLAEIIVNLLIKLIFNYV